MRVIFTKQNMFNECSHFYRIKIIKNKIQSKIYYAGNIHNIILENKNKQKSELNANDRFRTPKLLLESCNDRQRLPFNSLFCSFITLFFNTFILF